MPWHGVTALDTVRDTEPMMHCNVMLVWRLPTCAGHRRLFKPEGVCVVEEWIGWIAASLPQKSAPQPYGLIPRIENTVSSGEAGSWLNSLRICILVNPAS